MHSQSESRRLVIKPLQEVVHPFLEKNANNKFTGLLFDEPERAAAFSNIGTAIVRLAGEGVVPKDGKEVFIENCANLLSGACAYDDTFMTPFGKSDLPVKIRELFSTKLLEVDSYRIELLVAVTLYENKKGNEITADPVALLKGLILNPKTDSHAIYGQLRKTMLTALEWIDGNGQEKTELIPENEDELLKKLKELHDDHVRLVPKEELKGEAFEGLSGKPTSDSGIVTVLPSPTTSRNVRRAQSSSTIEMNSVRTGVDTKADLSVVGKKRTASKKERKKTDTGAVEIKYQTPSPPPIAEVPSDKSALEAMLRASQERAAQEKVREDQRRKEEEQARLEREKEKAQLEKEREQEAQRNAAEAERLRREEEAKIKAAEEEERKRREIDDAKKAAKAQKRAARAAKYAEEIRKADEKIRMQERQKEMEAENKKREEDEQARLRKIEEDRVSAEREKKVRAEAAERQRLQKLQDEKAENEGLLRINSAEIQKIDAELERKRQELGSANNATAQVKASFLHQISADITRKHEKLVPFKFFFKGRLKDIAAAGDEYVQKDNDPLFAQDEVGKLAAKNVILDKLVNRGIYSIQWLRDNWLSSAYFQKRDAYRIYLDTRVAAHQVTQQLNAANDPSAMIVTMKAFFPAAAASFEDGVQQTLDRNQATRGKLADEIKGLEEKRRELNAESEQLTSRVAVLNAQLNSALQPQAGEAPKKFSVNTL